MFPFQNLRVHAAFSDGSAMTPYMLCVQENNKLEQGSPTGHRANMQLQVPAQALLPSLLLMQQQPKPLSSLSLLSFCFLPPLWGMGWCYRRGSGYSCCMWQQMQVVACMTHAIGKPGHLCCIHSKGARLVLTLGI